MVEHALGWGYCAETGQVLQGGKEVAVLEQLGEGDVVGVLLDCEQRKLGFFKNGRAIGEVPCDYPDGAVLRPAMSLYDSDDVLAVGPVELRGESLRGYDPQRCSVGIALSKGGHMARKTSKVRWRTVACRGRLSAGDPVQEFIISQSRRGYIHLGVCEENANLDDYVGHSTRSWSYLCSDGNLYTNSRKVGQLECTAAVGDCIGMRYDQETNSVLYYHNGKCMGAAFEGKLKDVQDLSWCVSLWDEHDEVFVCGRADESLHTP